MAAGAALFCSGGAGLVNEVVWQLALKRFLGGSESVSSMIVVVVFMLGLGAGSILMGRRYRGRSFSGSERPGLPGSAQ